MYRERIDLRAFVSCALSFSVGGYLRLPILAGGILLRFRLRHPRGHTRGRWFILAAEQALEESHLDTSISPILAWRRPNSHRPLCIPLLHARRDCAPRREWLRGCAPHPKSQRKENCIPAPQPVVQCGPHPRTAHYAPIRRAVKTEAPKRKKVCRGVEKAGTSGESRTCAWTSGLSTGLYPHRILTPARRRNCARELGRCQRGPRRLALPPPHLVQPHRLREAFQGSLTLVREGAALAFSVTPSTMASRLKHRTSRREVKAGVDTLGIIVCHSCQVVTATPLLLLRGVSLVQ